MSKKKMIAAALMVLALAAGILIMFYPLIAYNHAEKTRSEIQTHYEEVMEESNEEEIAELKANAFAYNGKLFNYEFDLLKPEENGYFEQLKLNDLEVIAYVSIPKINVELPVYHGIDDSALGRGCGHLPQSSLPVGGTNTHAVLSAHSGMAESPMFSDLPKLAEGDVFYIKVLDEVLTYEVDFIDTVLPEEVDQVQPVKGEDYCTLITCVPYNINTHRLLVRGTRIPTVEQPEDVIIQDTQVEAEGSVWFENYYKSMRNALVVGAVSILVFSGIMTLIYRTPKEKRTSTAQKYVAKFVEKKGEKKR